MYTTSAAVARSADWLYIYIYIYIYISAAAALGAGKWEMISAAAVRGRDICFYYLCSEAPTAETPGGKGTLQIMQVNKQIAEEIN